MLITSYAVPVRADQALPEDQSAAVILAYGRIGEDEYPSTSLRLGQFADQLTEFSGNEYNIAPLPQIIEAIKNGAALPANTIGITFAGAYQSAYERAMLPLIERQIPFTIFYAADYADTMRAGHLGWDQLKKLKQTGLVTFGLLPAAYVHLNETNEAATLRSINKARALHREQLGLEATLFSYPFGEYSQSYMNTIKQQGFTAAFGLHSGVVHSGSDFYALPRFSMTQNYGSIDRFQLVASALPLPVTDMEPADAYLNTSQPSIGFTVTPALSGQISKLSCFISEQPQPKIEILGENRVELRLADPLTDERTRINCTIPARDEANEEKWRWLGMLLVRNTTEAAPTAQAQEPATQPQETEAPQETEEIKDREETLDEAL